MPTQECKKYFIFRNLISEFESPLGPIGWLSLTLPAAPFPDILIHVSKGFWKEPRPWRSGPLGPRLAQVTDGASSALFMWPLTLTLPCLLVATSVTPRSFSMVLWDSPHTGPLHSGPSASSQSRGNFTIDWGKYAYFSLQDTLLPTNLPWDLRFPYNLLSPLPYASPRGYDHQAHLRWRGEREESRRRGKSDLMS